MERKPYEQVKNLVQQRRDDFAKEKDRAEVEGGLVDDEVANKFFEAETIQHIAEAADFLFAIFAAAGARGGLLPQPHV